MAPSNGGMAIIATIAAKPAWFARRMAISGLRWQLPPGPDDDRLMLGQGTTTGVNVAGYCWAKAAIESGCGSR